MMTTEEWNDKPCGGADPDTSPEAVERLVERMRTAYGGQLYRDCTATLRALSAALAAALSPPPEGDRGHERTLDKDK